MPEIYTPKITILPDAVTVEERVANIIINQVRSKPESVLTLPTGGTPIGVYGLLVAAYQDGRIDFSKVTTLNLDEYWPIDSQHPASYAFYMNEHFFDHVNIPAENRNIPSGVAENASDEARRYQEIIAGHSIDLGLITLGPGETCHIGFNERGSSAESRVRYVELDDQTKEANLRFFANPSDMPQGAITQGVADILSANQILFVATGTLKAWGVQRSLQGEVSSDAPASFLRFHPNVNVILDDAAANLL